MCKLYKQTGPLIPQQVGLSTTYMEAQSSKYYWCYQPVISEVMTSHPHILNYYIIFMLSKKGMYYYLCVFKIINVLCLFSLCLESHISFLMLKPFTFDKLLCFYLDHETSAVCSISCSQNSFLMVTSRSVTQCPHWLLQILQLCTKVSLLQYCLKRTNKTTCEEGISVTICAFQYPFYHTI